MHILEELCLLAVHAISSLLCEGVANSTVALDSLKVDALTCNATDDASTHLRLKLSLP